MDPSSNHIHVSSEISVDTQPHHPAAKNITHMDVALYKAAARGKIDELSNFQGFQLESLLTPNQNTVLHVHLANMSSSSTFFYGELYPNGWLATYYICLGNFVYIFRAPGRCPLVLNEKLKFKTSFIEQILSKCPSLLVQPNGRGQTPLHIAARNGHSNIVKFLINYKAKAPHEDLEKQGTESVREMLRKTDLESNTALHVAAQYGHHYVVQELLEFEDPHFSYPANRRQKTPFYMAARRGYHSLLAMMLEKFKSPNLSGPHGRTVLHAAAMGGDAKTTGIILEKKGNLAKETDENGHTPLHYAAHLDHYSVVKELLKWDESAAYKGDNKWGMTPLLMAARQGYGRTVIEIISSCPGCCEMKDKRGWNLLHFLALRQGSSEYGVRGFPGLRIFLNAVRLKKFITTPHASIIDLKDEKDALGITPVQIINASYKSGWEEQLSGEKNQCSKQMLELTVQLLGEIVKKKQVAEAPVRAIRDEKDALATDDKKEQIAKLLEDIVKDEVAKVPVRPLADDAWFLFEKNSKDRKDSQLVVATLIATVSFASAIAVPGGYKSDKGPDQGTPFLIRHIAFTAFLISDALAFIFSLNVIAMHLPGFFSCSEEQRTLFILAANYIMYAVGAMVIAFSTGTYAVLQPYHLLAISTCCIGLIFFFLACFTIYQSAKSKYVDHYIRFVF